MGHRYLRLLYCLVHKLHVEEFVMREETELNLNSVML